MYRFAGTSTPQVRNNWLKVIHANKVVVWLILHNNKNIHLNGTFCNWLYAWNNTYYRDKLHTGQPYKTHFELRIDWLFCTQIKVHDWYSEPVSNAESKWGFAPSLHSHVPTKCSRAFGVLEFHISTVRVHPNVPIRAIFLFARMPRFWVEAAEEQYGVNFLAKSAIYVHVHAYQQEHRRLAVTVIILVLLRTTIHWRTVRRSRGLRPKPQQHQGWEWLYSLFPNVVLAVLSFAQSIQV